ncbi:MAG TPA: efflux RND transporter periplasmic adaptor subunit, partial [Noviherbaspirillum sp.]|nr:efflux RND transporter periplasmic adaptor subunit [Noviherbaspirillum sp.]
TESGEPLKLNLLGTGLELREQALPVQLRIVQPAPALAVGQPVKVFVQLKEKKRGVVIPSTAAARAPSGDLVVWLHTAAERFVPHKVQVQPLDAASVVVTQGLAGGERVVVQGVPALAQVR